MKKNRNVYLTDILRAAADVETYLVDASMEDFITDRMLQDAVIRKIAIIGEAVKHLTKTVKKEQKDVPWKKIVGMRNIVIHDYAEVDLKIVWDAVKKDIPVLVQATQKILKESF